MSWRRGGRLCCVIGVLGAGCGSGPHVEGGGVAPKDVADAIAAVVAADRAVYAREVVNRLAATEKVITASEHFRDDKALPLPAQMLRMGAAEVKKGPAGVSYALLSPWPINRRNGPVTEAEKSGLPRVVATGQTLYVEETLGGRRYLTAMYPDTAVVEACAGCHDRHEDSPKRDFKVGDVMGALVVRVPLSN